MKMLIDSEWRMAHDGATREILQCGGTQVIDTVPQATIADVEQAVQAAQEAKRRMAHIPAHRRAAILFQTADEMERRAEELAVLLARENGKPIRQTREELAAAIRIFRGFGEESKRIFGRSMSLDMVAGMERHFAFTIRRPVGVVAAIVPFNYPVELYAHKAAAALAAGNAVIVKPPSDCPLTLLEIAGIIEKCGAPRAAHQVLTGAGSLIGEYLASAPGVDLISLTGSTSVGQKISRLAADTLKRVHLELGGNDATVICRDADLDRASDAVILGRLARGNGQICCAVKRVFVHESICDDFVSLLSRKAEQLVVGDPLNEATDVGPLINESAAIQVEKSIREAVDHGGRIRAGGKRSGAFVEPTVIDRVSANDPIMAEEVFGPVIPIVPFDSVDEAASLVNNSHYGLQASVFTNAMATALDLAYRFEVGGVIVNWSSAVRVENLPFGGTKMSGHGRESIHDTLIEMTEQKSVLLYNGLTHFRGDE